MKGVLEQQKAGFKVLFELMRSRGFTKIVYHFSGGGDEGNMEEEGIWEGLHQESDVTLDMVPCDVEVNTEPITNLDRLSYTLAWKVLEVSDYDWCNNDGGYGDIIFYVTPEDENKVICDMNVNVMGSEHYPEEAVFGG